MATLSSSSHKTSQCKSSGGNCNDCDCKSSCKDKCESSNGSIGIIGLGRPQPVTPTNLQVLSIDFSGDNPSITSNSPITIDASLVGSQSPPGTPINTIDSFNFGANNLFSLVQFSPIPELPAGVDNTTIWVDSSDPQRPSYGEQKIALLSDIHDIVAPGQITLTPPPLPYTPPPNTIWISASPSVRPRWNTTDQLALYSDFVGVQSSVNGLTAQVQGIKADVTQIQTQLVLLEDNVSGLLTSVANLNTKVNELESDVNAVETSVSAMQVTVNGLVLHVNNIDGQITTINDTLGTLQSDVDALQTEVEQLKNQQDDSQAAIVALQAQIGTINGTLSDLQSTVGGLQTSVSTLQTSVGLLQSDVLTIKGQITDINTELGTMQADINDLKTDVSDLKSTVITIQTQIIALQTDLGQANDKIDTLTTQYNTLNDEVTTLTGTVNTLVTDVATNTDDITALDTRLTSLESTVAPIPGQITALDGRVTALEVLPGEITALDNRVTALEVLPAQITALDNRVTALEVLPGEIDGLDTRVTALETQVATNTSDIATIHAGLVLNTGGSAAENKLYTDVSPATRPRWSNDSLNNELALLSDVQAATTEIQDGLVLNGGGSSAPNKLYTDVFPAPRPRWSNASPNNELALLSDVQAVTAQVTDIHNGLVLNAPGAAAPNKLFAAQTNAPRPSWGAAGDNLALVTDIQTQVGVKSITMDPAVATPATINNVKNINMFTSTPIGDVSFPAAINGVKTITFAPLTAAPSDTTFTLYTDLGTLYYNNKLIMTTPPQFLLSNEQYTAIYINYLDNTSFVVPDNIRTLETILIGGGNGGNYSGVGGCAGTITKETISVCPGQKVDIVVGKGGKGGTRDNKTGQQGSISSLSVSKSSFVKKSSTNPYIKRILKDVETETHEIVHKIETQASEKNREDDFFGKPNDQSKLVSFDSIPGKLAQNNGSTGTEFGDGGAGGCGFIDAVEDHVVLYDHADNMNGRDGMNGCVFIKLY